MSTNDLAQILMGDAEQPEPTQEAEPTGGTDEVVEPQTEEVEGFELEAETDGYEADEEDDEEVEAPETYTVKVDGEEVAVNLDELRNGYQRDADYRKKTMAVAEDRKALEAKAAKIDETIAELESFIAKEDASIDWEDLMSNDPGEYLRQKDRIEKAKAAKEQAQQERSKELADQRAKVVQQESQKLVEVMGGDKWTTENRRTDMKLATEYLNSLGVTDQEIEGIVDHKLWRIIFDASKAKRFQESSSKVSEEVRKAPKSVKPGQRIPVSERKYQEAVKRLKTAPRGKGTEALTDLFKTLGN